MSRLYGKVMPWLGLPLVYLGVAVLGVGYVLGLTRHNALLMGGLLLIVLGIVGYVRQEKRKGDY